MDCNDGSTTSTKVTSCTVDSMVEDYWTASSTCSSTATTTFTLVGKDVCAADPFNFGQYYKATIYGPCATNYTWITSGGNPCSVTKTTSAKSLAVTSLAATATLLALI